MCEQFFEVVLHGRTQVPIPEAVLSADTRFPTPPPAPQTDPPSTADVTAPSQKRFGVNVAGYLRSELGIGEVARQITAALDTTSIPSLPVGLVAPGSRQGQAFAATEHLRNPFPVNLICINADGLPLVSSSA